MLWHAAFFFGYALFRLLIRVLHKPLLLARCGARPEAQQNLSPLGGCSKF